MSDWVREVAKKTLPESKTQSQRHHPAGLAERIQSAYEGGKPHVNIVVAEGTKPLDPWSLKAADIMAH